MSTAKAMQRAKEVGIRKVIGSTRKQLILQFLMSLLCSIALLYWLLSLLYNFFNLYSVSLRATLIQCCSVYQRFLATILVMVIIGSFLSGLYPALVLSSFAPIQVLKGNKLRISHGLASAEVLVIGQFAASILLIAGTLTIKEQLHFMYQKDLV
jgi:putative ABC transport system permease protein